ncbi:hydroxymethylbilane synthase [Seleniivibrio woodruffii]|uniref:Porphobilinogen deaminase n=1 Tax=Seleniivibrio woodruffii TaxID=1078050 RepID=A0A4R1KBJ8_9BACT|nr:hydroxymethylbilane synthase [Seleniivibrio woodruffii]TCK61852.1 hydroxymethylbilane synthase [Seleniivibrio woodruffii]TVZ35033.1 hydroxymethylbilane synthase [Seleniivibrio woodruffii]
MKKVVIATRGSNLALWQAEHIKALLMERHGVEVELNVIKTKGDIILDVPLAKIGGKGLFVKEIEQALLDNTADIAVHSMKDVPMELPEGLTLYASPIGETPYDCFVSVKYNNLAELPEGAIVGTSSLRRKVQLKKVRPDLVIKDLRGNVNTRLAKLEKGEYDCIILAKAGLVRLGFEERVRETFNVDLMLPACCQGILGIEIRENDTEMMNLLNFLRHEETETRVKCERAFLRRLEGGCQAPIAGHSVISGNVISMKGIVSDIEGSVFIEESINGDIRDAEALGKALADKILANGGKEILDEIYKDA